MIGIERFRESLRSIANLIKSNVMTRKKKSLFNRNDVFPISFTSSKVIPEFSTGK